MIFAEEARIFANSYVNRIMLHIDRKIVEACADIQQPKTSIDVVINGTYFNDVLRELLKYDFVVKYEDDAAYEARKNGHHCALHIEWK